MKKGVLIGIHIVAAVIYLSNLLFAIGFGTGGASALLALWIWTKLAIIPAIIIIIGIINIYSENPKVRKLLYTSIGLCFIFFIGYIFSFVKQIMFASGFGGRGGLAIIFVLIFSNLFNLFLIMYILLCLSHFYMLKKKK